MENKPIHTIYVILVCLVFCNVIAKGQCTVKSQKLNNEVDSLFVVNFSNMDDLINRKLPIDDNSVDRYFIMLLTEISGINCYAKDYSGFCHFTITELNLWKLWYDENKNKLDSFAVFNGIHLLKKKSITLNESQELDSLLLINTFPLAERSE